MLLKLRIGRVHTITEWNSFIAKIGWKNTCWTIAVSVHRTCSKEVKHLITIKNAAYTICKTTQITIVTFNRPHISLLKSKIGFLVSFKTHFYGSFSLVFWKENLLDKPMQNTFISIQSVSDYEFFTVTLNIFHKNCL